jgi:hypothetical protein
MRVPVRADGFEALFLSGFGLAASAFGLPDIGFIGWGDLTSSTGRLRALLALPEYLAKLGAALSPCSIPRPQPGFTGGSLCLS